MAKPYIYIYGEINHILLEKPPRTINPKLFTHVEQHHSQEQHPTCSWTSPIRSWSHPIPDSQHQQKPYDSSWTISVTNQQRPIKIIGILVPWKPDDRFFTSIFLCSETQSELISTDGWNLLTSLFWSDLHPFEYSNTILLGIYTMIFHHIHGCISTPSFLVNINALIVAGSTSTFNGVPILVLCAI